MSMELGLQGKVALVTASSRGIGFGVAKVLAQEKCKVIISSRNEDSIQTARQKIVTETGNVNVLGFPANLTKSSDIEALVDWAVDKVGSIDILAYNTGPPKPGTFAELKRDDWSEGVKLLMESAVTLSKLVVDGMVKQRWGRLVFITSVTLRQPMGNLLLSNTVRLSLAGLSKSLAAEYGPKGITSNGIMQGHILTDRQKEIAQDVSKRSGITIDDAMKRTLADVPLGRYGTPEEVGYLVGFLASEKAAYINGAMIAIDGGLIKSPF